MTDSFASAEAYIALPRIESVAVAPGGERAILTVATLSADRTRYVHSLWAIDGEGGGRPRRLTPTMKRLGGARFTASGDLLFITDRRDGAGDEDSDAPGPEAGQVWVLPTAGGEARPVTQLAGGAQEIAAVAHDASRIVFSAEILRSANSFDEDAKLRAERKKRKVSAILHDAYPVRFWDHDLGPGEPHLLTLDLAELSDALPDPVDPAEKRKSDADDDEAKPYPEHLPAPRDLTPHPARTAEFAGCALTPDGSTLIASIQHPKRRAGRGTLVRIDTATGERATLFAESEVHFAGPVIGHDGTLLAFTREVDATPAGPSPTELWLAGVDGSDARRLASGWDRTPAEFCFAADDSALIVTADEHGRTPVFRVALDDGAVTKLTDDDYAYTNLGVDPVSGAIFALRSSLRRAPHPVRVVGGQTVTELATPAPPPDVPGRVEEVQTTAADGTRVRGWLILPEHTDGPAPLLLWIHGGPVASWSGWSWRWNAMLAAARGYAVLLPDPGLSTGYGLDFIARGWNAWGQEPYTDLMAITDAVAARDDIDAERTGALGGSFGGYMANWVAGHTDRFRAIVTHASLWALDAFQGTTDRSDFWDEIFTPEGALANSPHRHVAEIRTPMLVIHGDRDYRVPIGEGIRLWSDLAAHHGRDDGTLPHRYLYFPDENHWILSPQNSIVWWETVFAFLAEHVLGKEFARPSNLG
jgi:dipeptidyl aminopeptidase/acylaminoacyl peptidase